MPEEAAISAAPGVDHERRAVAGDHDEERGGGGQGQGEAKLSA